MLFNASKLCGMQVLKALLKAAPQETLHDLPKVLPALISKLVTSKHAPLIARLLAVCARLMLTDAVQFINYLAATPAPSECRSLSVQCFLCSTLNFLSPWKLEQSQSLTPKLIRQDV